MIDLGSDLVMLLARGAMAPTREEALACLAEARMLVAGSQWPDEVREQIDRELERLEGAA